MSSQPTELKINRHKLVFATGVAWIALRLFVATIRGINIGIEAISPFTVFELGIISGLLIWLHSGARPEKVATFLLITLSAPLLLFSYGSGGLQGPVVYIGLFFPVMAFLLIGRMAGWVCCVLLIVFYASIGFLNAHTDFLPENINAERGRYIAKAISLSCLTLLLSWIGWYYARLHDSHIAQMHKKTEELERIAQYRQDFLANMSHEFRTPLNSIIGFTRRVLKTQSDQLDQRSIDALSTVLRTGDNLHLLINQILSISKLESGNDSLQLQEIPLYSWLEKLHSQLTPSAEEKGLCLHLHADDNTKNLTVHTDTQKLTSVLLNLIGNSIKYTQSGKVSITYKIISDDHYCIIIEDTGPGIPEDKIQGLFDKFSRLEQHEKSSIAGTGLGLAIVEETLKYLQGHITVTSVAEKGSQFTVTLPRRYKEYGQNKK